MTYVEGFVTAVPTANKQAYIDHAKAVAPLFKEHGITRLVEAWGEDVPRGKVNDLWSAVDAREDESVVFSWFEYPDKATRDAAVDKVTNDPRMKEAGGAMPFDGQRMIWGGFESVNDSGRADGATYVDGVVMPVRSDGRDAYVRHSATSAPAFLDGGALRVVDAIADDVQRGKVTDFQRAVRQMEGETVGYGWIEWPDKAARDTGWEKIMADPRMAEAGEPPFDGKRMIFGGFDIILDM